ncbi:hypothetical protein Y032_0190g1268 [Ancylostoma ceylanicum]|nr:hypothetical protein Y032_0190g1268 [Ancylostoma ceylanicum]
MQSLLPSHSFAPSGWNENLAVPSKSMTAWNEMKATTSKQPLILRKSFNTKRAMLYPVKKVVFRQQDGNAGPAPKRACGTGQEVAATIHLEVSTSGTFRISALSCRPLTLMRPVGNVFNLQAPDGGRAATPLLQPCEPSGSGTVSTEENINGYPHNDELSRTSHNQHVSRSGNAFDEFTDLEKSGVRGKRCRPQGGVRQPSSGTHSSLISSAPYRSERLEPPHAINLFPGKSDVSAIQSSEGTAYFRPQFVNDDEKKFSLQGQHQFTDSYRSNGPETVFPHNDAAANSLLTPPLSDRHSPTGQYLCGMGDHYELQTTSEQYHYPTHSTPPAECFPPQARDIDYSIFDEFFVRT